MLGMYVNLNDKEDTWSFLGSNCSKLTLLSVISLSSDDANCSTFCDPKFKVNFRAFLLCSKLNNNSYNIGCIRNDF